MSPRILYEQELEMLKAEVQNMGEWVEAAYERLFQALDEQDAAAMHAIIENDRAINDMQRNIEARCLTLLTRQQPVARDLRLVSTALKVVTDIERIGDHVSDMAELFLRLELPETEGFSIHLPQMILETQKMIHDAVAVFTLRDVALAGQVITYDDVVDEYFNLVKEDLVNDLKNNIKNPDDCIDMLMIAKYLEKISDHAVNIAEWEIFRETGDIQYKRLL